MQNLLELRVLLISLALELYDLLVIISVTYQKVLRTYDVYLNTTYVRTREYMFISSSIM